MKRGQAAIEFLMTYGWAMMSVMVVIGSLAYFGILSPSAFLPERCEIMAGFVCSDFALATDKAILELTNNLGEEAKIIKISLVNPENAVEVCGKNPFSPQIVIKNGEKISFNIQDCSNLQPDVKTDLKIKINYAKIINSIEFGHIMTGRLYAMVGSGISSGTTCPSGKEKCGTQCIDPTTSYLTDSANCGSCGNACGSGEVCQNGFCMPGTPTGPGGSGGTTCQSPQEQCGTRCINPVTDYLSDSSNCGSCGNACGSGEVCQNGFCMPGTPTAPS